MTYKEFKKEIKEIEKEFDVEIKYDKDEIKAMKPAQRKARVDSLTLRLLFIRAMAENLDDENENTTSDEQESTENNANNIKEILEERGSNYGDFDTLANLSQTFKVTFDRHVENYGRPELFTPQMSEAIEMIFHKLSRIANATPTYIDNWRDIAGYAQLIVKELETTENATDTKTSLVKLVNNTWVPL